MKTVFAKQTGQTIFSLKNIRRSEMTPRSSYLGTKINIVPELKCTSLNLLPDLKIKNIKGMLNFICCKFKTNAYITGTEKTKILICFIDKF